MTQFVSSPGYLPNLKAQYDAQIAFLKKYDLIRTLSDGSFGYEYTDSTGKKSDFKAPSYTEIFSRIVNHPEIYRVKAQQGFIKLHIVPVGLPTTIFIKVLGKKLKELRDQGRLLISDGVSVIKIKKLDVDNPVSTPSPEYWDQPSVRYEGRTLDDLVSKTKGFSVLLVEGDLHIPRANDPTNVPKFGRKRLEARLSGIKYLEILSKEPEYRHERGINQKEVAAIILESLDSTRVIPFDLVLPKNSSTFLGAVEPEIGQLGDACWTDMRSCVSLSANYSDDFIYLRGFLPAVEILANPN